MWGPVWPSSRAIMAAEVISSLNHPLPQSLRSPIQQHHSWLTPKKCIAWRRWGGPCPGWFSVGRLTNTSSVGVPADSCFTCPVGGQTDSCSWFPVGGPTDTSSVGGLTDSCSTCPVGGLTDTGFVGGPTDSCPQVSACGPADCCSKVPIGVPAYPCSKVSVGGPTSSRPQCFDNGRQPCSPVAGPQPAALFLVPCSAALLLDFSPARPPEGFCPCSWPHGRPPDLFGLLGRPPLSSILS